MTKEQKDKAISLKASGIGVAEISRELNVSKDTIKSLFRRVRLKANKEESKHELNCEDIYVKCLCCGEGLNQEEHKKKRKFCSNNCRVSWWNSHQNLVNRKANYRLVCNHCHRKFTSYGNNKRKYCSHKCYIEARFGGAYERASS